MATPLLALPLLLILNVVHECHASSSRVVISRIQQNSKEDHRQKMDFITHVLHGGGKCKEAVVHENIDELSQNPDGKKD
jgi:hypothetical protein